MTLDRVLTFGKKCVKERVQQGDLVVDGTMGNGHDTEFLAGLVGDNGKVLAFDIQETAVQNTKQRLADKGLLHRVDCIQEGHEQLLPHVSAYSEKPLRAAMFNLGYLPGGDKSIVTTPDTTITAISLLCEKMTVGGIISVMVYHGHEEGKIEKDALVTFVQQLDQKAYDVAKYEFLNQINHPPFLLLISKK